MGFMPLEGFHPTLARWFRARLGEPTAPQRDGWPLIREGRHTLIAAPTGSGKTLAAFLSAIDSLLRQGADLADQTQVLYVSPLRALSNDVQKNLQGPLAAIRALDGTLPEVRVTVRTGDTPAGQRTAMVRRPPHILVTTPESLFILLTSPRRLNHQRVPFSGCDPVEQFLDVYRLQPDGWLLVGTHVENAKARAEPFDAVELDLAQVWGAEPPKDDEDDEEG